MGSAYEKEMSSREAAMEGIHNQPVGYYQMEEGERVMEKELRDKLSAHIMQEQSMESVSDADIAETLREASTLKEYDHDEHRWYTVYTAVVAIGDMFIRFQTYTNTGDEPAFDREEGDAMILNSAVEVFPKQVTVVDYVPKEVPDEKETPLVGA